MAEITNEQLNRLHSAGAPLSSSWHYYAHPTEKAQWAELQNQSAADALAKAAEDARTMEGDMLAKLMHAAKGPQAILSARGDLVKNLQANILSYIANGHLHGFGFELPRKVSSAPVAIPKTAWAGKCDWSNGTLNYQGLQFVDVRLTRNRIRNEILERGNVDRTPPRAAGRPSLEADILAAVHGLHAAGEIDIENTQRSHLPKLRGWLELNRPNIYPPPNAISDETFRKHFSPFFNELKKNRKQ